MKIPKKGEIRKPSKTLAGVTPIAVMVKPRRCNHGTCVYCPKLSVPQSYTPKSPPVLRGERVNYDPYKQVNARLKAFNLMNHPTSKIELIIMGGTFLEYPKEYQYKFIKGCYDAMNEEESDNLEEAKKKNEKTKHRCVALCIETRPDVCGKKEIRRMLEFGATRVELGVQIPSNEIYEKTNRGHNVKDVINATKMLKDSGFKVGYHIMPGLPGSNKEKDLEMIKKIFSNQNYRPDQLKIYPCQVIEGSELEKSYNEGKYRPYNKKEVEELLIKAIREIPSYCRVMRIMRQIAPSNLVAGITRIDLRRDVEKKLKENDEKIEEIRFREIGFNLMENKKEDIDTNLELKKIEYSANNGEEIFLQFVNKDNILFGLLRLRFPDKPFLDVLKNSAIVRELHVYGKAADVGEKGIGIQHSGLGKKMMKEAEKIAKKKNKGKIAVVSGVGVREYYENIGYKLDNSYMLKKINKNNKR